jgi:hypothetical protein
VFSALLDRHLDAQMEIEIEICSSEMDDKKKRNRINALLAELEARQGKIQSFAPIHGNSWLLSGEDALPLLGYLINSAERGQFSYKVRFRGLEPDEVVLWSRVFDA